MVPGLCARPRARGLELELNDTLKRPLRDLRISVTDRCNFRCRYCMPKEVFGRDYVFLSKDLLLSFEEILRLARIFSGFGLKKIRLTGGEPLLRRDIETLVAMLAGIPGVELTLTTNGSLLAKKACRLAHSRLRSRSGSHRSRSTWSPSAASTKTASCRWRVSSTGAVTSCASSSTWMLGTRTDGAWMMSSRPQRSCA